MFSGSHGAPGLSGALINSPERQLFVSRDLAQTRNLVAQVMKQHDLRPHDGAGQVSSRMHHMAFGGVSLNRLLYGTDVEIEPGCLEDFYLVQMPLAGTAHIASGGETTVSDPNLGVVISPAEPTVMRWSPDCDQLMVRIDRALVERAICAQSGRTEPQAPRFELAFRWRDSGPWMCLLHYLNECATQPFDAVQYRLMIAHLEQLVVATLLAAQPHDLADMKPARCGAVLPRHVRRVQDYLREHAHEPICADQMALIAGVSLRSLYAGFREYCGVSPMHYLRNLRLDGARRTLLSEPDSNIANVAMAWGFCHLGRFSTEYRQRFGETPSQTVRRR